MMGADYYQTEAERFSELSDGKVPVGIGENTKIRLPCLWLCVHIFVIYLSYALF